MDIWGIVENHACNGKKKDNVQVGRLIVKKPIISPTLL
jgi:hypothetical protein